MDSVKQSHGSKSRVTSTASPDGTPGGPHAGSRERRAGCRGTRRNGGRLAAWAEQRRQATGRRGRDHDPATTTIPSQSAKSSAEL